MIYTSEVFSNANPEEDFVKVNSTTDKTIIDSNGVDKKIYTIIVTSDSEDDLNIIISLRSPIGSFGAYNKIEQLVTIPAHSGHITGVMGESGSGNYEGEKEPIDILAIFFPEITKKIKDENGNSCLLIPGNCSLHARLETSNPSSNVSILAFGEC